MHLINIQIIHKIKGYRWNLQNSLWFGWSSIYYPPLRVLRVSLPPKVTSRTFQRRSSSFLMGKWGGEELQKRVTIPRRVTASSSSVASWGCANIDLIFFFFFWGTLFSRKIYLKNEKKIIIRKLWKVIRQ